MMTQRRGGLQHHGGRFWILEGKPFKVTGRAGLIAFFTEIRMDHVHLVRWRWLRKPTGRRLVHEVQMTVGRAQSARLSFAKARIVSN